MRNQRKSILAAALLLLLLAAPVLAQNSTPKGERGPMLWWPITNTLSPAELKSIWEDESLHRARYVQAVEEGLREPLPDEKLDRLVSFWDGASTPELFPIWRLFDAYSTHFAGADQVVMTRLRAELRGHGFDAETTDVILGAALRQLEESQELVSELREDSLRFVQVQREALSTLGRSKLRAAVDAEDVTTLALATSRSPHDIRDWMQAWKRSPSRETVVPVLKDLKADLSQKDWDLLRSFLYHHIAPQVSTIDFAPEDSES